jgi:hypothetical protein
MISMLVRHSRGSQESYVASLAMLLLLFGSESVTRSQAFGGFSGGTFQHRMDHADACLVSSPIITSTGKST